MKKLRHTEIFKLAHSYTTVDEAGFEPKTYYLLGQTQCQALPCATFDPNPFPLRG